MATFDFSTGRLTIDDTTSLHRSSLSPGSSPMTGAIKLVTNGSWENYGIKNVNVWGKNFGLTARYRDAALSMLDFVWTDGVAGKDDWSATENDLLKEKKTLSKMLATFAQAPCVSSTIGADVFDFSWGTLTVRADLRSMGVMISLVYTPLKDRT